MRIDRRVEDLLRELAPQILGALVRRYGHFDAAEDAVQEALLAAAQQWPADGVPDGARAWLIRVASRRLIDQLRSDRARRDREAAEAARVPPEQFLAPPPGPGSAADRDDSLVLLFLCCHPALPQASQVALTLRAVGGLTTREIARALLVPEPTMGRRISRAKQQIAASGVGFALPPAAERAARLHAVLQVLYLVFNEGYTSASGTEVARVELSDEAVRLTRMVHRVLPDEGEVAGLLALMLLTDARRPARTAPDGALVPMAEQDRTLWNRDAIAEGEALVTDAMSRTALGPYQMQAAIAAVHAEATRAEDTDWKQIVGLYGLLEQMSHNPMVTVNRAVAVAMAYGPAAGLTLLARVAADGRLAGHHRLDAVRAHLLEMTGDHAGAAEHYRIAARRTDSLPEQRYLLARADRADRDGEG
ncbi:RNA polymerase sigma factor [Pseudonocardia nigra]|uniref:RNA polymerase sigma factor n=1 Tax=Pseudonocardia nigra TaxID=1921578 RepID=UPI0027E25D48|nr:sigma-70 family RNA polymerase sigma factor [Pseudonocardia nigra]